MRRVGYVRASGGTSDWITVVEQAKVPDVVAGIVTFNPDLDRLEQNLSAVAGQVEQVVVFDNGSENIADIESMSAEWGNVQVLRGEINHGVAYALNRLLDVAVRHGQPYLLTLDQDSIASPGMVGVLRASMGPRVAMVTPLIVDRNKSRTAARSKIVSSLQAYSRPARRGAITSGALLAVDAADQVGRFDERLFIDYVDYDLNARLMINGYRVIRASDVELLHEVGRAQPTWLYTPRRDVDGTWRLERFYAFGHNAQRCYYKARNRVIFTKKYGRHIGFSNEGVWQIPQQVLLTLLFESDKTAKLMAFARGFRDGLAFVVESDRVGLKRAGRPGRETRSTG